MSGLLLTHRGSTTVPREALYEIVPPAPTKSWTPIAHGTLIDSLVAVLAARGLAVKREEYAIQREGKILYGVMDLAWGETDDFYAAIGIRTSNNKVFPLQLAIGIRVLVCDNLAFHGDLIALRRKHTGKLDLDHELSLGVDRYIYGYEKFARHMQTLQSMVLTPLEAREQIYRAFAQKLVPMRLFLDVAPPYLAMTECPTSWDVLNSFTSAAKKLKPTVQFEATVRLGHLFTSVEYSLSDSGQKPGDLVETPSSGEVQEVNASRVAEPIAPDYSHNLFV